MIKKLLFVVLFAVVILAGRYTTFHQTKSNAQSIVEKKISSEIPPQKVTVTRKKLQESKYIVSPSTNYKSSFPKECDSSLSDLSAMTAEEYKDLVNNKQSFVTFFGEKCAEQLALNQAFEELAKQSNCKILAMKEEKQNSSCLTMMFILKAYFIADHTFDKKFDEMSSQELAANFVRMFFSIDKLNKETFVENIKLIDSLYERHRNDPDVIEATLGYLMIGKQITKDNTVDSKIDSILQDIQEGSFKVDRLQVFKDVLKNNLNGAKETLDKLNNAYPKEPELAYYYAAYYWKTGNRNMANVYLDKAITLGDKCSYCTPTLYAETKAKMAKAKDKDDKLFSLSIGLNFENL